MEVKISEGRTKSDNYIQRLGQLKLNMKTFAGNIFKNSLDNYSLSAFTKYKLTFRF